MIRQVIQFYFVWGVMAALMWLGVSSSVYAQDRVNLTKEEKNWIAEHEVVRVGCAPDWPPFLFFNNRGQEVGIGRDYMTLISMRTGLEFEHIFYDTWDEVLEAAKRHEVDVISTINENPQRARYLLFTDSYFRVGVVIIGARDIKEGLRLDTLGGLRVAAVRGGAVYQYLKMRYSELNVIEVMDDKEGLEGVAFHKYDVLIGDLATASYYIDQLSLTNLRVVGRTPLEYNVRIGSRRDWPILNGILNKGLNSITFAERKEIERRWVSLSGEGVYIWPQYFMIGLGVFGVLVVTVVVVLIWNRTLRRKVSVRTEELRFELEEHKRTETALRDSEEHFKRYFDMGIVGMAMSDEHGQFVDVNAAFVDMLGYSGEQLKNATWVSITYPEDISSGTEEFAKLVTGELDEFTIDKRYVRRDGSLIYAITSVRAIRQPNGKMSQAIAMVQDISDRKRTEIRQKTMMQELDHRVKNNLAEVLALAEHTLHRAKTLDDFRESFLSRVRAMAKTHEALAASKWEGVDLSRLVHLVLDAHMRSNAERVKIVGDEVVLPSRTCSPLCMTINELSANAAKYGALSNTCGKISIEWWYKKEQDELRILWKEFGGPEVRKPKRTGFGTKLMKGLIEYELQGEMDIQYPLEGLVVDIRIKLAHDHLTHKKDS